MINLFRGVIGILIFGIVHSINSKYNESETYGITMRAYDVLTEECKERQSKAKGLMQLVVCDNDILYRCIEEVKDNNIKITKYFPDGHIEYETKQPENII